VGEAIAEGSVGGVLGSSIRAQLWPSADHSPLRRLRRHLPHRGRTCRLIPGIIQCEQVRDYVSRELLREILSDTEEHIDFLEMQLGLVKSLGEQNYLQSAVGELPA
jgi:hypothetical protein